MPTEQQMAQAAGRHIVRAAIRDYCRTVLFAAPVRGVAPDPLTLPRRSRLAAYTEEDVYTSHPGSADRRVHFPGDPDVRITSLGEVNGQPFGYVDLMIGYSGLTEVEAVANAAMGSIGPMALQLRHKRPSYRAFLAHELRDAQQAPLHIDQARVLDAFALLGAGCQHTLRCLDQSHPERRSLRAIARREHLDESTLKKRVMVACDALAEALYTLYDVRAAA